MWEQSFLEGFSEFSLGGPRLRWLRVRESGSIRAQSRRLQEATPSQSQSRSWVNTIFCWVNVPKWLPQRHRRCSIVCIGKVINNPSLLDSKFDVLASQCSQRLSKLLVECKDFLLTRSFFLIPTKVGKLSVRGTKNNDVSIKNNKSSQCMFCVQQEAA